jgi:hypothetical protein
MWIKTKDKLINTRHLAEIKITAHRMVNGSQIYELSACPARKENQASVLFKHKDKFYVEEVFERISTAIDNELKEIVIE